MTRARVGSGRLYGASVDRAAVRDSVAKRFDVARMVEDYLAVYRQIIEQFELGMGSALSVLLFLSVLLIAWLLVKTFRVDLASARGEG